MTFEKLRLQVSVKINFGTKFFCLPVQFSSYRFVTLLGPEQHIHGSSAQGLDFNQSTSLSSSFAPEVSNFCKFDIPSSKKNVINSKLKYRLFSKPFLDPQKRPSISLLYVLLSPEENLSPMKYL